MSSKQNPTDPIVTFNAVDCERELSAAAGANNITTDAQWQALIDPLVDAFVNSTSASVAAKTMMKAVLKALLHGIRINKFD